MKSQSDLDQFFAPIVNKPSGGRVGAPLSQKEEVATSEPSLKQGS